MTYPYGVHVAVVRVARDTGGVSIERYLVAYDIGKAVNPMLVEGQIAGGAAQGIGGALYEEFCYDDRGEPLSVTFADYLMPTAREVPHIDVIISEDAPSPLNPLGLKGAGEGGANAVGAALAAAIDDALGLPGAITQLPVSPQKIRLILKESKPRNGADPAFGPSSPCAQVIFLSSRVSVRCSFAVSGRNVLALISAATRIASAMTCAPFSVSETARRRRSVGSLPVVTKPRRPSRSTTPLMVAASR